jgi:hypothetical protein
MKAEEQILRGLPGGLNTQGINFNAILRSIGAVDDLLRTQATELKKQTIVFTADGVNLDVLGANVGVVRPPIGVADNEFKQLIALLSYNPKQVKPILFELLALYYGRDYTNANVDCKVAETYDLNPNDDLIIQIDENPNKIVTIVFNDDQFQNINAAKADEIAAVIDKALQPYGASAFAFDDLLLDERRIRIRTNSPGTLGHVRILGGQAQRKLQFEKKRDTLQDSTTQFTITTPSGVTRRFTWSSGTDPKLDRVSIGDYVVIGDPLFATGNRGTFTVTAIAPTYFEIENQLGSNQVVTIGAADNIMFFDPVRADITKIPNYSTIYQINPQTLTVILPAAVPIVRKSLKGSHHFHATTTSLDPKWPGSFLYDTTQPLQISSKKTFLSENIAAGTVDPVLNVDSTANFPSTGFIVLDFGKDNQEGPIEYLNIASGTQLSIDPSVVFQKGHSAGGTVYLLESITGPIIDARGNQYPVYLTSTAPARIDLQDKIKLVTAAGIIIEFIINYPEDRLFNDKEFWYDRGDEAETDDNPVPDYDPDLPW